MTAKVGRGFFFLHISDTRSDLRILVLVSAIGVLWSSQSIIIVEIRIVVDRSNTVVDVKM